MNSYHGLDWLRLEKDLCEEIEVISAAEMIQDIVDSIPLEELDDLAPAVAIHRHLLSD